MSAFFFQDHYVQIDIIKIEDNMVTCNLFTGSRCIKIYMSVQDSDSLIRDGFFVRKKNEPDGANVLNTTIVYVPE